jgi:hypothetical protein
MLTDGEGKAERPDFEEDGGGALVAGRSPRGGDVPVHLR